MTTTETPATTTIEIEETSTCILTAREFAYQYGHKPKNVGTIHHGDPMSDRWTPGVMRHVIAALAGRRCMVTVQHSLMHMATLEGIGNGWGGGNTLRLKFPGGHITAFNLDQIGAIVPLPNPGDTRAYTLNHDIVSAIRKDMEPYTAAANDFMSGPDGARPYGRRRITPTLAGARIEFVPQADAAKVDAMNGSGHSVETYYACPEWTLECHVNADGKVIGRTTFKADTIRPQH